jgi:hypothetical protein
MAVATKNTNFRAFAKEFIIILSKLYIIMILPILHSDMNQILIHFTRSSHDIGGGCHSTGVSDTNNTVFCFEFPSISGAVLASTPRQQ